MFKINIIKVDKEKFYKDILDNDDLMLTIHNPKTINSFQVTDYKYMVTHKFSNKYVGLGDTLEEATNHYYEMNK